jgi:hypothetical protein
MNFSWRQGVGNGKRKNIFRRRPGIRRIWKILRRNPWQSAKSAKNVMPMAKDGETAPEKLLEWEHVNSNKISVDWIWEEAESVPVVSATGLEILAVDRLVQFVRNNPNGARYSAVNNPKSGKPITIL